MMDNSFDDLAGDDEMRAEIARRARSEGIKAAYESALAICQDKNAPAQAKSNASRTLFEIGGMLNRADRKDESLSSKEPHEMTGDELRAYKQQFERKARQLNAVLNQSEDGKPGGAFD
ncbi:hypothetical protein M2281_001617 [Mesorhizobium soli]|uniref:hypothetical protein n=1 Tax=Pseudaminobacter soli (ex Li et al. 2025) TaxID=1295366 RepID=UPI0024738CAC|nr:hypothetical protein [Mesorhizobium soli]MDH6231045.1 hypothetical protein [Mesorhizobium soli]